MKRTNVVLDEAVLNEARRLSGEKTYSAAIMKALNEFIRRMKVRQVFDLQGIGWEGDLSEMRDDRPRKRKTHK